MDFCLKKVASSLQPQEPCLFHGFLKDPFCLKWRAGRKKLPQSLLHLENIQRHEARHGKLANQTFEAEKYEERFPFAFGFG